MNEKKREVRSRFAPDLPEDLAGQQESRFFANLDVGVVHRDDLEVNLVRACLAGIGRHCDDRVERLQRGRRDVDFNFTRDFGAGQAVDRHNVAVWLLFRIHDLQHVDVLDPAIIGFAGQR